LSALFFQEGLTFPSSSDRGKTWSEHYFTTIENPEQHIATMIWSPE